MKEDTTDPILVERREMALLHTFPVPSPFGFTTQIDDITSEGVSWVFAGDLETPSGESICYVLGKIIVPVTLGPVLIITWFPSFSITFFIPFE